MRATVTAQRRQSPFVFDRPSQCRKSHSLSGQGDVAGLNGPNRARVRHCHGHNKAGPLTGAQPNQYICTCIPGPYCGAKAGVPGTIRNTGSAAGPTSGVRDGAGIGPSPGVWPYGAPGVGPKTCVWP